MCVDVHSFLLAFDFLILSVLEFIAQSELANIPPINPYPELWILNKIKS